MLFSGNTAGLVKCLGERDASMSPTRAIEIANALMAFIFSFSVELLGAYGVHCMADPPSGSSSTVTKPNLNCLF